MKLQHYLGGLEGLGPVTFEKRVFVEKWEERIFGIHTAMMALSTQLPLPKTPSTFHTIWTWADLRKGAESLNPFDYFKFRYYEKWLVRIVELSVRHGLVTREEVETGKPAPGSERLAPRLTPERVAASFTRSGSRGMQLRRSWKRSARRRGL